MINSLTGSLGRITIFWYLIGVLVLFFGFPEWAELRFERLALLPWVPEMELDGLSTAAAVQWRLLTYWTMPVLALWFGSIVVGAVVAEVKCQVTLRSRNKNLLPTGEFWGVTVATYSLGSLPMATTPKLVGKKVSLQPKAPDGAIAVQVKGALKEVVKMLTPAERQTSEELIQLLLAAPEHYAGLGHGVGLLEHTLNVVAEASSKCTSEFRLPFLAALAHDIGKLITFVPDGKGGWTRKGLHSRESARILVTLPGFRELPEIHQNGLILAVKYDHAPNKMPALRGDKEASMLGLRIISALSQSDRAATAGEKDRHLERLQPEDLLWKDFVDFIREAPVVQRGKPGVANQLNNPADSPYLYIYEAAWRDAAVRRMPPEVAAALDLTRRDAGKLAKYTRILTERLRKEGLLLETYNSTDKDGVVSKLAVSESNPLWDIQSGTGEKAVVLRGILIVNADELWKKVNFRLGVKSPYPVAILAPNANAEGRVNSAPQADREDRSVETSDSLKLADITDSSVLAAIGLADSTTAVGGLTAAPKQKARGRFQSAPPSVADSSLGLVPNPKTATKAATPVPGLSTQGAGTPAKPADEEPIVYSEDDDPTMELDLAGEPQPDPVEEAPSVNAALAYLSAIAAEEPAEVENEEESGIESAPEVAVPTMPAQVSESGSLKVSPSKDTPKKPEAPAPVKKETANPVVSAPKPPAEKPKAKPPAVEAAAEVKLSWSEGQAGLALADAAAVAKYPGLALNDKYYTETSPAVKAGQAKPGAKYRGVKEKNSLGLSAAGPRVARRKL